MRALAALAKILPNDPDVKVQGPMDHGLRSRRIAIPPVATGRYRRMRVYCDQAAFCRDWATCVAITSINAGDRQS